MRILVADDNKDTAQTLGYLLAKRGFQPLLVNDGLQALAQLQRPDAPALAALDWKMPGMNGIEVCRQIRKEATAPYPYLILVTGEGTKEQLLEGLTSGADDYLLKPVDPNELYARLVTGKRILDLQEQLLATQRLLRQQATRDSLTGLLNRATILETLDREMVRSRRERRSLTIIMADIDHFKTINDTHGHVVGDRVLRDTAQRLISVLRPYDTTGRYGGEEFLTILAGCGGDRSMGLANRLRCAVEVEPVVSNGRAIPVTLSLGVAVWDGRSSSQELVQFADAALYRAKRDGRNRIAMAAIAPSPPQI
jgi:diguanylate cyclase (GGDEF)-like protein